MSLSREEILDLAEEAFNEGWRNRESRPGQILNSRSTMRSEWRESNARDALVSALNAARKEGECSTVAELPASPDGLTVPPIYAGNLVGKPLPDHLKWPGPGPEPASWEIAGHKVYRSYEDYCDD